MKTSINSVKLSGCAGSDLKITMLKEKGKKVGRVSIAVNSFFRTREGEPKEKTNWFNLVFWNEKATEAKKAIKKGTHFTVEGHLTSQTYKDAQDQTKYSVDITVEKFTVDENEK